MSRASATWVEGQFGVTWWQASQSFPLSQAAGLLDGSAEWLRGLVAHPLADAASAAGAAGPVVDIGAGITANFVTAPLTGPLEGAARGCEIAGIVIGLATGAHPLVIACAKRLAHDEAGQVLSRGFERVITSIRDPELPEPTTPAVPPPPTTPGPPTVPATPRVRATQGPPGSTAPVTGPAAERYWQPRERPSGPPSAPPPPSGPAAPRV